MIDPRQRIWGFESNFGGMAQLSLMKVNQLMPMPTHLSWEEAASLSPTLATSYRILVSRNGGGIPVCVVSSQEKVNLLGSLGVDLVIGRKAEGYEFWKDELPQPAEWRRFGKRIRSLTGGQDPDIVFEHPGRQTFGASLFVVKRGGVVVTCVSTSGYLHEFDNRYLWMNLKRIIGSHFANYKEAWETNRLVNLGMIHPILTQTYPLDHVAEAAYALHTNVHTGKLGVLIHATEEGQGVQDPAKRARFSDQLTRWKALS